MRTDRAWLGVVLAGAVVLAGCGGGAADTGTEMEADAMVLAPSEIAVVGPGVLRQSVLLTGSLQPHRVVNLTAQVPGTVQRVLADRGTVVRQGQALAVIEAAGIRGQAEGARAGVQAAETALALAEQQLESARSLYEAGAMAELDYKGAQAGYEAAVAQLAAARAAAAGAGEAASRATITAPMDGAVSQRWVEAGEPVNPGQPTFTVVNTAILELVAQVPVEAAARIRPAYRVLFELAGYEGQTFEGTVDRIEPTADPDTRQVGVYARLDNRDLGLVGGLFARGRIITGETRADLVIPAGALRGGDEPYVYALRGGVVEPREVRTGGRDEVAGLVAITAGLAAGDTVIVVPTPEAAAGARVRIGAEEAMPRSGEED
jgi:membrane fusion protein (multidrug efflux system)